MQVRALTQESEAACNLADTLLGWQLSEFQVALCPMINLSIGETAI